LATASGSGTSARAWKITTIRAMIWAPYQGSENPAFYQVDDDGKIDPRLYGAEEFHPLAGERESADGADDLPALPHDWTGAGSTAPLRVCA